MTSLPDEPALLRAIERDLDARRPAAAAQLILDSYLEQTPDESIALLRRVLALLGGDELVLRGRIGHLLVIAYLRAGRLDEALDAEITCLAVAQEADDGWGAVVAEAMGGLIAQRLGEREASRELIANAAHRAAEYGPAAQGLVLAMRGQAYLEDGEPDAAVALAREAIALATDETPVEVGVWTHAVLAHALVRAGRADEARVALATALEVAGESGALDLLTTCLDVHAAVSSALGHDDDASAMLAVSDALRTRMDRRRLPYEEALVAGVRRNEVTATTLSAREVAARARAELARVV